jgi:hypothetical protein
VEKWKWIVLSCQAFLVAKTVWALWGLFQVHALHAGPRVMNEFLNDPHFLSGFYVFMAAFGIALLVNLNRGIAESRKAVAIRELEELTDLADRFLYHQNAVNMKDAARSRMLYRKYQSWLPGTEIGKPDTYHYRAARCVAALQVHGYLRGRLEIARKNRNG